MSSEPIALKSSGDFFAKVMLAFGMAVLLSAMGVYIGMNFFISYFKAYPGLAWGIYALELILVFTARYWSTKKPLNYGLFALFATCTGLTIVPLISSLLSQTGGLEIITKALVAATLVFTGMAILGWVTKRSLAGLGGFLWAALLGMIIVGILGIFIPWGSTFEMLYAGFGAILFAVYTMYDFQRIKEFPSDRYIDAALEIYLDIFNLFLFILRLLAPSRD